MAGIDYEEKRDFVRMRIATEVTYNLKENNDITHRGTSIDLSATGLYMLTDHQLKSGAEIEIIMYPSGDRLPPFLASGNVIRCEADEQQTGKFYVSVELTQTD